MRPAALKHLHSAGGVIYKKTDNTFEIALIAIKDRIIWTLPKGIIDKDEKPEQTAVREIEEETGLTGEILEKLGEKSYWFTLKDENVKCRKTVTYFLLKYSEGTITKQCTEVDDAVWIDLEEAIKQLSYKSDREIVEKAKEKLLKDNGQDTDQG